MAAKALPPDMELPTVPYMPRARLPFTTAVQHHTYLQQVRATETARVATVPAAGAAPRPSPDDMGADQVDAPGSMDVEPTEGDDPHVAEDRIPSYPLPPPTRTLSQPAALRRLAQVVMAQLTPADRALVDEALTPHASTQRLSRSIEATMDPAAVPPPTMIDRAELITVDMEHDGDGHLPPAAQRVAARPQGDLPQPPAARPWT